MKGPKLPAKRWKKLLYTAVAAAMVIVALAALFQTQIQRLRYPLQYTDEVGRWSAEYEVDPMLVFATIKTESGFRPGVDSGAGARGLMQMTEDTFDWIKSRIAGDETLAYSNLYEPETAIRFGVYYLSISLKRYGGDVSTAAAAYHSGWGTVDRLLDDAEYSSDGVTLQVFPYPQMAHYVDKIQRHYAHYSQLYTQPGVHQIYQEGER